MSQCIGVYPVDDESATTVGLLAPAAATGASPRGWARIGGPHLRVVVTGVVAVLLVAGAVAGERAAVAYIAHDPDPYAAPDADPDGTAGPRGNPPGAAAPGAESRVAWARHYGQRRAVLPNLPDVASSSPQQRDAAADLLTRTTAGTATYAGTDAAQAAGYDFAAGLAQAKANPLTARRMARVDGGVTVLRPVVVRAVSNAAQQRDGRVLDAGAPQALIYAYQGHDAWKLIGAVFRADGAYPNSPPDPGGPITRWSYTDLHPAALTMELYFVAPGDLVHAYALTPPGLLT